MTKFGRKISDVTVTATDLGEVLGITARRVRQLAEDGVFERSSRGEFPLVASANAYIANAETRSEPDDLRRERIRLIRAQARKLELENSAKEGTKIALDYQEAVLRTFATHIFLRLRPIADWLHAELFDKVEGDVARVAAGSVQGWIVGARSEIEQEMLEAIERSRRRGYAITDYFDLQRLLGHAEELEEED